MKIIDVCQGQWIEIIRVDNISDGKTHIKPHYERWHCELKYGITTTIERTLLQEQKL